MSEHCPTCGAEVRVVGDGTLHYEAVGDGIRRPVRVEYLARTTFRDGQPQSNEIRAVVVDAEGCEVEPGAITAALNAQPPAAPAVDVGTLADIAWQARIDHRRAGGGRPGTLPLSEQARHHRDEEEAVIRAIVAALGIEEATRNA